MRTTLKDIANYLNVSTTTVSRALNDKDDISRSMRERVLEVARMLDYKPNSIAISLRKKTSRNLIGVIIPVVDHHFYSGILKGITTTGFRDDYMVMIGETGHDVDREKQIINRFQDHYVAGIIFIPSRRRKSIENVPLLQRGRIPFILIDRIFENYKGSYIQHDDFAGAFKATNHLISKGRTKIAMLKGNSECNLSQARYEGYRKALTNARIKTSDHLIISCDDASLTEGYEAARSLFENGLNPDAFFCITDQLALGVMEYAGTHDISIPKDLSVVGYSNSQLSRVISPKLTTVAQDAHEMGRLAKEYLIEMCHHENIIHQEIFPSELIIREST